MYRDEKIAVILNPKAGVISKDDAVSFLFKYLRKHFNTVSLMNSNSPEHGESLVKESLPFFDIIAVFGGDGTINSVAQAMVGSDKTLGILPGGSGNGLVRNLKIPLNWRKACEVLTSGKDQIIDIGQINNKYFFNVAGVGLDGLISKKFEEETNKRGIAPYLYFGFKSFFEVEPYKLEILHKEEKRKEDVLLMAFANFPQYGGKAIIAPHAQANDGLLDLCILNKFKFIEGTRNLQSLFNGNIDKLPFYSGFKFEDVTITPNGKIPCTIDGEYGGELSEPFTVKVLPKMLKVRVPS